MEFLEFHARAEFALMLLAKFCHLIFELFSIVGMEHFWEPKLQLILIPPRWFYVIERIKPQKLAEMVIHM